jgi:hypothetical protein
MIRNRQVHSSEDVVQFGNNARLLCWRGDVNAQSVSVFAVQAGNCGRAIEVTQIKMFKITTPELGRVLAKIVYKVGRINWPAWSRRIMDFTNVSFALVGSCHT